VAGEGRIIRHTTIRSDDMTMLKRSPSLTEQTRLYIKERILNNAFGDDGRLPPETELAQSLGVSRTTVREALSKLEKEGAIIRKQGAGTFVNQQGLQIKWRLDEAWSYESVLRANGYTPTVEVLRVSEEEADPQVAQELDIAAGDPILVIEKLFREDETPVILTVNRIPKQFVSGQIRRADVRKPIYEFLAFCCHQQLLYYLSDIVPVVVDARLASLLVVSPDRALLSFDEIGFNANNQPILKAISYFRDDRIRFRLIRRPA